jgi:hypothetical protein
LIHVSRDTIPLKKQLSQLSRDTVANAGAIKTIEGDLNILVDTEMRAELESYRHYDILHNEQMTPRFLSLSKIKKKPPSLEAIRRDDGSGFETQLEREEFICGFYENIYSQNQGIDLSDTVIEEFLGPEICNNVVTLNSKLLDVEKNIFEREISLQELDIAVQKLNEKSAGGLHGISSKFIKKILAVFTLLAAQLRELLL